MLVGKIVNWFNKMMDTLMDNIKINNFRGAGHFLCHLKEAVSMLTKR